VLEEEVADSMVPTSTVQNLPDLYIQLSFTIIVHRAWYKTAKHDPLDTNVQSPGDDFRLQASRLQP